MAGGFLTTDLHGNHFTSTQFSSVQFSSVQSLSRVQLLATPWITACQTSLSITNSWSLFKLMPIKSVMPSSHLILCCPLLLLPPIPPSIKVFSNESALPMGWPKYWSFSFSISPSNEHPGLSSFRMDRLDLLAVQGTLHTMHYLIQLQLFVLYLIIFPSNFLQPWFPAYWHWHFSLSISCLDTKIVVLTEEEISLLAVFYVLSLLSLIIHFLPSFLPSFLWFGLI